jgi:hypothetical protein
MSWPNVIDRLPCGDPRAYRTPKEKGVGRERSVRTEYSWKGEEQKRERRQSRDRKSLPRKKKKGCVIETGKGRRRGRGVDCKKQ